MQLVNTPDYCDQQCWYDQAIAVAPDNPNLVFVGGNGSATVYRSTDGGAHWTNVTRGADGFSLHADLHALAFSADGHVLYAGNDGGVWKTSTPTATPIPWTELNDTLAITQFYFSPSISSQDVANGFGGTQDNGTQKYDGVLMWNDVVCGDGGWTAEDPSNSSNVYSSCTRGNGLVWKSTGGGVFGSWSLATSGINSNDTMEFLPPLTLDFLHPANLYFGTNRVYQTTNHGSNWTPISAALGNTVTSIAVAPTDSNIVYAATSHGPPSVQLTTNALAGVGAVWNPRSTGLPRAFVSQVVVDPHTSTTAYVALSGFNLGHVFRTADGGITWKDVSGNLPNIPVNAIVVDPVLANTYYVATDIGVFRTRNGGGTWSVLGSGLPRVTVLSDATPAGTTFVGFSTILGTCAAPAVGASGTLSCKVGDLASGAKATVSMRVRDTAAAGNTLTDTGRVFSNTPDPNTRNNAVTVKTGVD